MNEDGPKAGARTLQERWKGRLAREWFDAPPGINSGDWHLFCRHTQDGRSLADLQAQNATTFPTVDALREVLAGVEARLVEGNDGAAAIVAGGFGEPEPAPLASAAPMAAAIRASRESTGGGKD